MTSEVYQEASSQKTPAHRKKKTTLPLRRFEPSVPVSRISIVGLMSFGQRWQWCSRSIGCLVRAVGSSVLPSWARPRPSRCRRSSYARYMFLDRDPIRSMRLLRYYCQCGSKVVGVLDLPATTGAVGCQLASRTMVLH
jgi:hypothetical protein